MIQSCKIAPKKILKKVFYNIPTKKSLHWIFHKKNAGCIAIRATGVFMNWNADGSEAT